MMQSKQKSTNQNLMTMLVLGLLLVIGGMTAMYLTAALNPATTTQGEELDLVYNLYYRRMMYVDGDWQPEALQYLGRYIGGYVVGMRYCNSYTKTAVTLPDGTVKQAYVCDAATATDPPQGPVTSAGFGILYQEPDDNQINLLIPLPCTYLAAGCSQQWMSSYWDQVLPWFQYGLKRNSYPAGHEFQSFGPLGGQPSPYNDNYDYGYVSLEIKADLEDLD